MRGATRMIGWFEYKAAGMEGCSAKYVVKDGREFIAFLQPGTPEDLEHTDYYLSLSLTKLGFYDRNPTGAYYIPAGRDELILADDWLQEHGFDNVE